MSIPEEIASDIETIGNIIHSQAEAWGRADADGYAANAGDDLAFTNIRGQRWVGREHFVTVHRSVLGGVYAGSRLDAQIEQITFPGKNVAVAEVLLRLSNPKGMPAGVVADADGGLRTRLLEIFERRDNGWTLITCHNTPVII
jgi:uncharacterized protein (TIGR02246 family)